MYLLATYMISRLSLKLKSQLMIHAEAMEIKEQHCFVLQVRAFSPNITYSTVLYKGKVL